MVVVWQATKRRLRGVFPLCIRTDCSNFAESRFTVDTRTSRAMRLWSAIISWGLDLDLPPDAWVLHITLTFKNGDREEASGAIRSFLDTLKKSFRSIKKYFWVAELQRRGVIHYHLVVTGVYFIPIDYIREIWRHGHVFIRRWRLRKVFEYLMKYFRKLKKRYQTDYVRFSKLYKHFRIFSSNRVRDVVAKVMKFPKWLREWIWEKGGIPRRYPGVGWVFPDGEVVKSPWRIVWVDRGDDGGYFLTYEMHPLGVLP